MYMIAGQKGGFRTLSELIVANHGAPGLLDSSGNVFRLVQPIYSTQFVAGRIGSRIKQLCQADTTGKTGFDVEYEETCECGGTSTPTPSSADLNVQRLTLSTEGLCRFDWPEAGEEVRWSGAHGGTVKMTAKKEVENCMVRTLHLRGKSRGLREVFVFEINRNAVRTAEGFRETMANFIAKVDAQYTKRMEEPFLRSHAIFIHSCRADDANAGLFIALDIILRDIARFGARRMLNVREVVRQIRSQGHNLGLTREEYRLVYDTIDDCITRMRIYTYTAGA